MVRMAGFVVVFGGLGHIVTGLVIFRPQLAATFQEGFVNRVLPHFDRRAAFWFILFGVMVTMSGHVIVHASYAGDVTLLKLVGWYLLGVSTVGTLAMTRSPSSGLILLAAAVLWSAYRG